MREFRWVRRGRGGVRAAVGGGGCGFRRGGGVWDGGGEGWRRPFGGGRRRSFDSILDGVDRGGSSSAWIRMADFYCKDSFLTFSLTVLFLSGII